MRQDSEKAFFADAADGHVAVVVEAHDQFREYERASFLASDSGCTRFLAYTVRGHRPALLEKRVVSARKSKAVSAAAATAITDEERRRFTALLDAVPLWG